MTFIPRPPGTKSASTPEGPQPRGMAGRIKSLSDAPPPAPKGKGLVMILLGVAVVGSLLHTFLKGSSAAEGVREAHEESSREGPVAPSESDAGTFTMPGASFELPEGLPERVEARLRETLSTFEQMHRFEENKHKAFRELPPILASVPEAQRSAVQAEILKIIVRCAGTKKYGRSAFEAAAWIAPDITVTNEDTLIDLVGTACTDGIEKDEVAGAALLFLSRCPLDLGRVEQRAIERLILDEARPVDLRLRAAELQRARGIPLGPKLAAFRASATTSPLLRDALADAPSDG